MMSFSRWAWCIRNALRADLVSWLCASSRAGPPFHQGLGKAAVNKPLTFVDSRKPVRTGNTLGDTLGIPKRPKLLDGAAA